MNVHTPRRHPNQITTGVNSLATAYLGGGGIRPVPTATAGSSVSKANGKLVHRADRTALAGSAR
jgi:hypothetical protein